MMNPVKSPLQMLYELAGLYRSPMMGGLPQMQQPQMQQPQMQQPGMPTLNPELLRALMLARGRMNPMQTLLSGQ